MSGFLLGLGVVSAATSTDLHLEAISLSPQKALGGVFILGILGLLCTALAFTGILRALFPFWAALVVGLMIKGFFLSAVTFGGPDSFPNSASADPRIDCRVFRSGIVCQAQSVQFVSANNLRLARLIAQFD